MADVDAGAVAADVDHLVRVGAALDVVAGGATGGKLREKSVPR